MGRSTDGWKDIQTFTIQPWSLPKKRKKIRKRILANKTSFLNEANKILGMKQVTRGHNIVADGWAGACNPHPHPRPPHSHSNTQIITTAASKMRVFALFNSIITDGRTNGRTNGRTDKASYKVACPQLNTLKLQRSKVKTRTKSISVSVMRW